mmetsp:Transcript_38025/g.98179  ORF Transcript_38025/g.98179 Transcript_38025/m.98179 type:complete len:166 (-) Transcript_38025:1071-1568(-)|eukprot:CAMPEP_0113893850 /NCGR_PEP_ID=MMETSP0780_2-20120614/16342_1 /TAXON_ID=652834 /ORGANISM="Palpitomonas bilix" /LENGTH=165 /DNA_ID=CAMNT_0000884227 /DNA_START=53 /DNA_END=550 /DNA_ORIENTATION=+ /assembly_acc=CAM_ASM_000599
MSHAHAHGYTDLYGLLRVKPEASAAEIKKAYRNLALKLHPDLNPDSNSHEADLFKKITEAYNILSDARLRRDYDYERNQHKIQTSTGAARRRAQEESNAPYDFESWYRHHYAQEERKKKMHGSQRNPVAQPKARLGSVYTAFLITAGVVGLWAFNIKKSVKGELK